VGSISDKIKVIVRRDSPKTYKCRICGREYYTRSGARQHVKRKHLAAAGQHQDIVHNKYKG
jgi:hypothetical protein